jgi:hypothetical protein
MKISMLKKVVLLSGVFSLMIGYNLQAQDLNSAIQLTKSESYDKAADMYKALIQKEPGNSKNYYYYGENFLLEYFSDTISNSLDLALKSAQETYDKGTMSVLQRLLFTGATKQKPKNSGQRQRVSFCHTRI